MGYYAERINGMPKYLASRTLAGSLEWNATLIAGEVVQAVPALKEKHPGNLIVSGCGELAHTLAPQGLVDEFWFWVNPTCGRPGHGSSIVSVPSACRRWRSRPTDPESSGYATGLPGAEGRGS